jgi:hypothetical protein
MYIIGAQIRQAWTYFIAVPFLPMALEVYPHFRQGLRGTRPFYFSFKLKEMIAAVQSYKRPLKKPSVASPVTFGPADKKQISEKFSITRIKCKIDGDELIDTVAFKGKDVPHSTTYKITLKSIRSKGPKLGPEQVRLKHSMGEQQFTIEMYKHGHCKFWLSSNASNISAVLNVAQYLDQHELVKTGATFPYMASLREEEEGDRE